MPSAHFRFYGSLNDFLAASRRQRSFEYSFAPRAAVKDLIEAIGVPHPEVDLIIANGASVDFSYQVSDRDEINVYPLFESAAIDLPSRVRPAPLAEIRFVLDCHLGKLASHLRLCGFDTCYRNDFHDEELARISAAETRVLLTRDQGLLKRGNVIYGYWVRATSPRAQLLEVARRYRLAAKFAPFARCINCNGSLRAVSKDEIDSRLQPRTRACFNEFLICRDCQRIYWGGSHYDRMVKFIESVRAELGNNNYE